MFSIKPERACSPLNPHHSPLSTRWLVPVAARTDADEAALLEGDVFDEAVAAKIVNPFVDHDLDDLLPRLAATNLAPFARAGSGDATAQGAVFDALRGVVRLATNRLHVVARVSAGNDATVATQAVGVSARAHRKSGEDQ